MEQIKNKAIDLIFSAGPKLLIALAVLVIGHILIRILLKVLNKALVRFNLDESLVRFFKKTINIVLHIFVILSALTTIGISTTGILAAMSAAAVAVSLALKDSLANIASGILILMSKPFSTGDFIEVGDKAGTVVDIGMMSTIIITVDNRRVIIPNSQMSTSQVIDYSVEELRRVDVVFSVGYGEDVETAKSAILGVVNKHSLIIKDDPEKAPFARVSGYGESSVAITCRVWCKGNDYWNVYFDLMEQVKADFDRKGITIPFNQLDVHIVNDKA